MTKISGKTVLITGGAAGIGKLMGESCLLKGATKLIIWDINEDTLNETAKEFSERGFKVSPYKVDVSNLEQIQQAAALILKEGAVDILINNAGIVTGQPFYKQESRAITKTLAINVEAVMQISRVFLPAMIEQKSGHIVNIASAAGMMSNPNMSVYAASKWAVLGWSESLRIELESMKGDLHVTTVTPGYIDTGMFDGVKSPLLLPLLKPEAIVKAIIKGVERNKLFVRKPFMVNHLTFVKGILPIRVFDWFVGTVLGVYKSMDDFKGH
jgi:all-trans-retinol dehydrogenase (NAD+)